MHHSARLIDDLTTLSDALDDPGSDLPAVCGVVAEDLAAAIPAFLGLTVMVHIGDNPLLINSISPRDRARVRTSLQLSLLPLGAATTTGTVAFYGGTPGVFLALADDVRWIFNLDGRPILDGRPFLDGHRSISGGGAQWAG
ncbi:hypothetical protein ACVBEQ_05285 [Nakamurella sp. GG22]